MHGVLAKILGWTCSILAGGIVWFAIMWYLYDLVVGRWLRARRRRIEQRPGFAVIHRLSPFHRPLRAGMEENVPDLLCLDPRLEDHHVVGEDLQQHVALA